jgi:hypothetical protein
MESCGVCIVSSRLEQNSGALSTLVSAAGFKLRSGASLVPDLILTRKGQTHAFVFIRFMAIQNPAGMKEELARCRYYWMQVHHLWEVCTGFG